MEWYMIEARKLFQDLLSWMADTTILTVNGIDITFLRLLLFGVVFDLVSAIIFEVLPGWLGKEKDDFEAPLSSNPYNTRSEDNDGYVYGEEAHGWSNGRWSRW